MSSAQSDKIKRRLYHVCCEHACAWLIVLLFVKSKRITICCRVCLSCREFAADVGISAIAAGVAVLVPPAAPFALAAPAVVAGGRLAVKGGKELIRRLGPAQPQAMPVA